MRNLCILALVAILIPGCAGEQERPHEVEPAGQQGAEPTQDGDEPEAPAPILVCADCTRPPRVELQHCDLSIVQFQANSQEMSAVLPSGYSPTDNLSERIGLDAYLCERAIVGNLTLSSVQMYLLSGLVQAPPNRASAETGDSYVFELATNSPQLLDIFLAAGFPALNGTFLTTAMDPTFSAKYDAADRPPYVVTAGGVTTVATNQETGFLRMHGPRSWMDWQTSFAPPGLAGLTGMLQASSGMVTDLSLTGRETPATVGVTTADVTILMEPETTRS